MLRKLFSLLLYTGLLGACADSAPPTATRQSAIASWTFEDCIDWQFTVATTADHRECHPVGEHPLSWYYDKIKSYRAQSCGTDQSCIDAYKFRMFPMSPAGSLLEEVGPSILVAQWNDQVERFRAFAVTLPTTDEKQVLTSLREVQDMTQDSIDDVATDLKDRQGALQDAGFEQKLIDQARPILGDAGVELAEAQTATKEVNQILTEYQAALVPLATRMTALASSYTLYRVNERTDLSTLDDLAHSATSVSSYADISDLRVRLADVAGRSSASAAPILLEAIRLGAELTYAQTHYGERLALYQDTFDRYQIAQPYLSDVSPVVAERIQEYVLRSQNLLQNRIASVLDELNRILQLLQLERVSAATRAAVSAADRVRASARFLDEVSRLATAAWKDPVKSQRLALPYLAPQYASMLAVMDTRPLCQGAIPDYAFSGCQFLSTHYQRITTQFTDALPLRLRRDANRLSANGIDASQVLAALQRNDLTNAVALHDEAVRASEQTP